MKLVFVADDLGYCPKRSRGIFELLESGQGSQAFFLYVLKEFDRFRANGFRTKHIIVQNPFFERNRFWYKNGFRTETVFVQKIVCVLKPIPYKKPIPY